MDNSADMVKVTKSDDEIVLMSNEEIKETWHQQTRYLRFLEHLSTAGEDEAKRCEQSVDKAIQQAQAELESIKSGDVTVKEQPDSDSPADAKGTLKDPYVNLLVQKLRSDLKERESRIENLTAELNAWQLTSADGSTVDEKKAMAKCRLLANENCELGDQVSESRLSHIKAQADEVQASFLEVTRDMQVCADVTGELESDLTALQGTLMQLYQSLRTKGKASSELLASLEYNHNRASSSSASGGSRSKATPKSKSSSGSKHSASKNSVSSISIDTNSAGVPGAKANGKLTPTENSRNSSNSSNPAAEMSSRNSRADNGPVSKRAKTSSNERIKTSKHDKDKLSSEKQLVGNGSLEPCDNISPPGKQGIRNNNDENMEALHKNDKAPEKLTTVQTNGSLSQDLSANGNAEIENSDLSTRNSQESKPITNCV